MASISAFAAKTRFGELLARVARGEEIVITKHDKPVARIIPEGTESLESVRSAVDALFALRAEIKKGQNGKKLSLRDLKSAVEEGRR